MKNTQFSAKCRYCIPTHHGTLSRAALGVSKAFFSYAVNSAQPLANY